MIIILINLYCIFINLFQINTTIIRKCSRINTFVQKKLKEKRSI